ncbi:Alpha/Beta hydrolase protein [Mycena capillaripes]|nr:Alpha/Beta hydrolase protein [Mycena capillaripes]
MSLRIATIVVAFLSACWPAGAMQAVFSTSASINDGQTFAPLGTLNALSETSFTTLTHREFPGYGVRIKKSKFCDEGAKNDPDNDDVIFWTNGGPGCSPGIGLFMELGPCRVVNADNGTVHHPESWNSNANIMFVDQPINVGFSYAEYGEYVSTTEEAAQDIAAFVAIFFAHFTKFQGRGFHMSGESYGGRYVPVFAAAVYDQNPRLVKAGIPPINLTSVMIGNGMTDIPTLLPSWYEMQCSPVSLPPVHDIKTCVEMKARFDFINCGAALWFCSESISDPSVDIVVYDLSKKCGDSDFCYEEIDEIAKYLNRQDVQEILGVEVSTYDSCSETVELDFAFTLDLMKGATEYVSALLERDVRVLIYVGTYDWICNWLGNEAWTLALEWSGHAEFSSQPLREWNVDARELEGHEVRRGSHSLPWMPLAIWCVYDVKRASLQLTLILPSVSVRLPWELTHSI